MAKNPEYRLYHYWRSTSSWRVRFAMAHKGVEPEYVAVDLLNGESESEGHRARNPLGYVPVLELTRESDPKRRLLTESVAILEYLEETVRTNPLLPADPLDRARVRSLVEIVNSETQPLQNLSVQILLAPESETGFAEKRKSWAQHWIRNGLRAYESLAATTAGLYSVGDRITLADACLAPQCYAALRNDVAIADYPTIARVHAALLETDAYRASEPDLFKPTSAV